MRIAARWFGSLGVLLGVVATMAMAVVQTTPRPGPTINAQRTAARTGSDCFYATDYFRGNSPGARMPVWLYDIDRYTGASSPPRVTNAPPLIDLAWAADGRVYGVSTSDSGTWQPDALYRIDPQTGATTLIGATGLHGITEGDLATDPRTGMIYGISGISGNPKAVLFRFPNLTATTANPAAQQVGLVQYSQFGSPNWDISGLAAGADGKLYALVQDPRLNGPPAHLIRLDLNNIVNGVIAIDIDRTLSQRFHSIGGLEFFGGNLFYADGEEAAITDSSNNLYQLYRILTNGTVVPRGYSSVIGGVSSLISCRSQIQPPPCAPPPPGMEAWYAMEGNGNDRILAKNAASSGAVSYPSGRVGQSLRLQGGYLSVPDGPALDQGLGDFSIDLWMLVAANQAGVQTIIDKRGFVANTVRGWVLFLYNRRPGLQLADGSWQNFTDSRTMAPGWRHVMVTVDRDNPQGLIFYIDGVAGTPLNPTSRPGNLDNGAATWFGRDHWSRQISARLEIDEVEFFGRALAPAEPLAIFNAGQTGKCFVTGNGTSQ